MSERDAQLAGQRDLFADLARDTGAQAALASSPYAAEWRERAEAEIRRLASSGRRFTSDDVRAAVGDPPTDNAMGAVILAASRARLIREAGLAKSSRISRHSGAIRAWVGAHVQVSRDW